MRLKSEIWDDEVIALIERQNTAGVPVYNGDKTLSVAVPVYNTHPIYLMALVQSLKRQICPRWELVLYSDGTTAYETNKVLNEAEKETKIKVVRSSENRGPAAAQTAAVLCCTGDYVALCDHDDLLLINAISDILNAFECHEKAVALYTWEIILDQTQEPPQPILMPKMDFDIDLLLQYQYCNHMMVFRREALLPLLPLRSEFDGSQDYDLMLRASGQYSKQDQIHCLSIFCYVWRQYGGQTSSSDFGRALCHTRAQRAIQSHLWKTSVERPRVFKGMADGIYAIAWPIEPEPRVRVIICSADNAKVLYDNLSELRRTTSYGNYEVVVVDTGTKDEKALKVVQSLHQPTDSQYVVRSDPHFNTFNFSWANNIGVMYESGESRPDLLCFLNDDCAVTRDWLTELVRQAVRPNVGVVGARLIYPDGSLQHIGASDFGGGPFHPFQKDRSIPSIGLIVSPRAAVTAACMLTWRNLFESMGGFRTEYESDYQDVDYCYRVLRSGKKVIYTPYALGIHQEGTSRGCNRDPARNKRDLARLNTNFHEWHPEIDPLLAAWTFERGLGGWTPINVDCKKAADGVI